MNANDWRDLALKHERDALALRTRLAELRIDPETLAVFLGFEAGPVDPERLARARLALRAELATVQDRKAQGMPTDAEVRQGLAVADAILAALGEPAISNADSGSNLAPWEPETRAGRTTTAVG